ncbi:MarR family winged helix-turn-helix transcriptional regulator [Allokutzneria sp. A3M-2-11 16]|uniref:MarR family winged helix-turn-helix transcriptional regulator n=1 Tax=Allokutzneria sp. A3M-2-11 16 TaxID=2962043 RepID=UPI0020B81BFF|nr:MarR family winged helix-turn-helix transcriptional regulator [Allokutzneria sp. A3M-2-11 16]MCP3801682.1 MarR family winged helix-turn-helix transcriptional regulator [Allokutzneria sp. A3M-2-11 16]
MAVKRGGPELFRLVRFWSRRWAGEVAGHTDERVYVQVVEAVSLTGDTAGVAHQLGVDRSVASRMITEAVAAGYVAREASAVDARRVTVRLTDAGAELLDASHRWQQERFDSLVAHWEPADRKRFADYLHRLAAEVVDER